MNLEEAATELHRAFETSKRDDGAEFLALKDNSPSWMTEAVHAAHGDMMPEDWRYQMTRDAAAIISEYGDDEDAAAEALDGDVSVYNADLLAWVAASLGRAGYVDDAVSEYGWPEQGLYQALQMGQLAERREVYDLLLTALVEHVAADAED